LRDAGVLIAGSGGVVHNLELYSGAAAAPPLGWAVCAEQRPAELPETGVRESLVDRMQPGNDVGRGIPAPEHHLPLLCVPGASSGMAQVLAHGIEGGSIPLLTLRIY